MKKTARVAPFTVLVGLLTFLCAASAQADDPTPRIAPIHTTPAGQTYGRWAAEWWQWALGIPGAVNPLTDTTGAHCAQRQVDAVWFLAGTFFSTEPVVRTCEVPEGKSLFFPLINHFYGAFLNGIVNLMAPPAKRRCRVGPRAYFEAILRPEVGCLRFRSALWTLEVGEVLAPAS